MRMAMQLLDELSEQSSSDEWSPKTSSSTYTNMLLASQGSQGVGGDTAFGETGQPECLEISNTSSVAENSNGHGEQAQGSSDSRQGWEGKDGSPGSGGGTASGETEQHEIRPGHQEDAKQGNDATQGSGHFQDNNWEWSDSRSGFVAGITGAAGSSLTAAPVALTARSEGNSLEAGRQGRSVA